jgi:hypothetical protein
MQTYLFSDSFHSPMLAIKVKFKKRYLNTIQILNYLAEKFVRSPLTSYPCKSIHFNFSFFKIKKINLIFHVYTRKQRNK